MFAIICNARKGSSQGVSKLALVDRTKSRKLWWTSDRPGIIETFGSKPSAQARADMLKQNAPRVVPLEQAKAILTSQSKIVRQVAEEREKHAEHMACMDAVEMGWDGHKNW